MGRPLDGAEPSEVPFDEPPKFSDDDFDFEGLAARKDGRRDGEFHPVALAARRYWDAAAADVQAAERAKPPPPRAPFLIGVFEFPWYPSTMQCWIPMTLLLLAGGVLLVFSFTLRASFLVLVFVLGYICACCLTIVQHTADGLDEIEDWPAALDWKEWMWSLFQVFGYLLQAVLVAFILAWWSSVLYWIPALLIVYVAFPIIALAGLEADSWLPMSPIIWRTLKTHWWAWAIFYLESALVLAAWSIIGVVGAAVAGLWSVPVTTALLAAVFIIYARLLGRLGWCLNQ